MKPKQEPKIVYYENELQDEFSTAQITPKRIDGSYRYDRTSFWGRVAHFFWYRIVATPLAFCYLKLKFRHKIVNRSLLKGKKKQAYFIYGNHTQAMADALAPTFVCFPKDAYLIVHPNNVSIPFVGRVTPYLGALPLPDDMEANRNFIKTLEKRVSEGRTIFIYPEAHIWPYCTKIRNFGDQAFYYPIKHGTASYCFTNTYQKRKHSKKPRLVTYIDGPFYPDPSLNSRAARKKLRDEVYHTMCQRSLLNEITVVDYQKKEEKA